MIYQSDIQSLAREILDHRDKRLLIQLPSLTVKGYNLAMGYKIGNELHHLLLERGYLQAGRKIGFTNQNIWTEFNITNPIWAHMYKQTIYSLDSDALAIFIDKMLAPRIEPEIVVKLSRPLINPASLKDIVTCIEWVAIGFEIVDCHYSEWKFNAEDTLADFGLHAALVVGTPWNIQNEQPETIIKQLKNLKVTLYKGSEIIDTCEGKNAMGNPLNAIEYLVKILATQSFSSPLSKGEIITTGTLTSPPFIHVGEQWNMKVDLATLNSLSLEIIN